MTDTTDDQKPDEAAPADPTGKASHALDGALDALQGILEERHVVPCQTPGHLPANWTNAAPEGQRPVPETLPLLDDVVIPGSLFTATPVDEPHPPHELPPCTDLVKRLVSEVQVIIEERVQEALNLARDDIKAEVRRHLEIVLPEILGEILERYRRERG